MQTVVTGDLSSLRGPFRWVCWTALPRLIRGGGGNLNARDVAQLPMWVGFTADGGSVLLFADECEL